MASIPAMKTSVLPLDIGEIGKIFAVNKEGDILDDFDIQFDKNTEDAKHLLLAADHIKSANTPVAFPTETVYGLGADATRSSAVLGIYKAKRRPADNPLIVHFASLDQLRQLLRPLQPIANGHTPNEVSKDPIPAIYHPLISKFWPGPLTIILPNPPYSPLAPEVTAGLSTFGARIPRHALALALIKSAGVPIAAPSANASTKPSPTAAEHVAHDLDGRIELILDGGPCDVGVESTVVDGLSDPPLILRPGGISIEQLRTCPGWEMTQIGYKNVSESGHQPRAPGMKYRHYSPKATVILYEAGENAPTMSEIFKHVRADGKLGIITTKSWSLETEEGRPVIQQRQHGEGPQFSETSHATESGFAGMLERINLKTKSNAMLRTYPLSKGESIAELHEVPLGMNTAEIARGIFSALRDLDRANVDVIVVEGIDDAEGDTAAAVMNRLRKAAEIKVGT